MNDRIGELLVQKNLLSEEQLRRAKEEAQAPAVRASATRSRSSASWKSSRSPRRVSTQYGVPTIELDDFEVDAEVISLIPEEVAQQAHDPAGEPRGLDADHRDVRPVQHLRDRRHQVPHRLQRRGRGRGRGVDPPRDRAATTTRATDLDEVMAGFDDSDFEVVGDDERLERRRAREGGRGRAGRQARQPDPDRRDQEERVGHPRRAVREGLPRPLPHRRRALRGDAPAAQAAQPAHLAHQDHGRPRHRRAPPAAGRTHQAEDGQAPRRWTTASPSCPRSSARRSSCVSSTRATCSST